MYAFYFQLHMLGDGSRGAILEMTLSKILYMSSEYSKTHTCILHLCNGHSLWIRITPLLFSHRVNTNYWYECHTAKLGPSCPLVECWAV